MAPKAKPSPGQKKGPGVKKTVTPKKPTLKKDEKSGTGTTPETSTTVAVQPVPVASQPAPAPTLVALQPAPVPTVAPQPSEPDSGAKVSTDAKLEPDPEQVAAKAGSLDGSKSKAEGVLSPDSKKVKALPSDSKSKPEIKQSPKPVADAVTKESDSKREVPTPVLPVASPPFQATKRPAEAASGQEEKGKKVVKTGTKTKVVKKVVTPKEKKTTEVPVVVSGAKADVSKIDVPKVEAAPKPDASNVDVPKVIEVPKVVEATKADACNVSVSKDEPLKVEVQPTKSDVVSVSKDEPLKVEVQPTKLDVESVPAVDNIPAKEAEASKEEDKQLPKLPQEAASGSPLNNATDGPVKMDEDASGAGEENPAELDDGIEEEEGDVEEVEEEQEVGEEFRDGEVGDIEMYDEEEEAEDEDGDGIDGVEEDAEEVAEEDEEVEEEEEDAGEEVEDEVDKEEDDFAAELNDAQVLPISERLKQKKLEIFVGGLDKDATEDDLKKVFEKVGEVTEVRLMRNSHTGKNKGFAFVRYANAAQAKRAATELEHVQVRGRVCGVVPSDENDILFISNINKTWKKEQIVETLKKFNILTFEELTLMEDPKTDGLSRGYAFLEFATHKEALSAYKRLQKPDVVFGADRSAKVAWAQPLDEPNEELMAQIKSVFIDSMPTSWDEEQVKENFGKYGEIERIVLARNIPAAKRKDFGFVNYATREAALACIEALNDTEFPDGDNKVKVTVTLAKPQLKTKPAKIGVRGGYPVGRHGGRSSGFRGGRAGRFTSVHGRGSRFGYGRGISRSVRGFHGSARGRFPASHNSRRDQGSSAQHLIKVLRDTHDEGPSGADRSKASDGGEIRTPSADADGSKFTRVNRLLEKLRREERVHKTPMNLLHDYAVGHDCEVHYDIRSDNPAGPFDVVASVGGGNTKIPLTKGVGRSQSKAKARETAASDAVEKLMDRVHESEFTRWVRPRDRPTSLNGRNSSGLRNRPPIRSAPYESRHEARRPPLSVYASNPDITGRSRSGHGDPYASSRARPNHASRDDFSRTSRSSGRVPPPRERFADYPDSSERRNSLGRSALAAHREAYYEQLERRGYGSSRYRDAIREYGEAISGSKRSLAALEEDPRYADIPTRAHPRARVDHLDVAASQYAGGYGSSSRIPTQYAVGPSGAGAASLVGSAVQQAAAYGMYDGHQSAMGLGGMYSTAGDLRGIGEIGGGSAYPSSTVYGSYSQGPVGGGFSLPGSGAPYY